MRVLVLGGTQFVGRHVVQALLDTLMAARHVVSCCWLVRRLADPAWRARAADIVVSRTHALRALLAHG